MSAKLSDVRTSVSLGVDLDNKISELAEKEGRKKASMIRELIKEGLKIRGVI